jgi:hypothetical protein
MNGAARRLTPPALSTVGLVVGASVAVTAFHFTDNYVSIETYPQPDWVSKASVLIAWPIFTALGIAGYLLYRRERFILANGFLLAYSYAGLSSLGHLLSGSPDEFTTRGLVSVLADGVVGSLVLAVAIWSILAHRALAGTPEVQARPRPEGQR